MSAMPGQNDRVEPEVRLLSRTANRAELGVRIRETRLAAGMTQAEVASGVFSVAYLSRIESGDRRPSPDNLEHIARALGTDVPTLLRAPQWRSRQRRPADHLRAHNVAKATAAWLRSPTDGSAYAGMVRAVASWEAQVGTRAPEPAAAPVHEEAAAEGD